MPSFEDLMLPHLPTAYNLARWLLRNDHDAEDSVQEAFLQALKAFDRFRGQDGRAWLMTIVRNTCYARLRKIRGGAFPESFDESIHTVNAIGNDEAEQARHLRSEAGAKHLQAALDSLPEPMREMIVLHDLEDLSYREIADVAGIPIGTVMSRLSRARARLQQALRQRIAEEETIPESKS